MDVLYKSIDLLDKKTSFPVIPTWVKKKGWDRNVAFYPDQHSGNFRMVHLTEPVTNDEYEQTQYLLKNLQQILQKKVNYQLICEVFKVVNAVVANPLSKAVFEFKMKAFYGIFKEFPSAVFGEETCLKLSVNSSFFPSAHEVYGVIQPQRESLEQQKAIYQRIVDEAHLLSNFDSGINNNMDKISDCISQKKEREIQKRVAQLYDYLAPIDHMLEHIQTIVYLYVPHKNSSLSQAQLISELELSLNQLSHPTLRQILQDKIDTIRSAQIQLQELKRVGIIS